MLVDVVQNGSRRHYAVPLMAERLGMLRYFYTDWYAGEGGMPAAMRRVLAAEGIAAPLRRMRERQADLPGEKVRAFNLLGLRGKWKLGRASDTWERTIAHHWFDRELCRAVIRATKTLPDAFVAFRGSDTLFEAFSGRCACVLDQIDGGIHEVNVVREEQARHLDWLRGEPDWLTCEREAKPFWLDLEAPRLRREWALADRILCNSNWTRECLAAEGVDVAKCEVVPLAFEPGEDAGVRRVRFNEPGRLTVAFLGTVTLRKGIHHLIEAVLEARRQADVRLIIAGSAGEVDPARLTGHGEAVEYRGRIARGDVPAFLDEADVLALPSVSEGFGIVQLEAMARGLPVVGSDRTGEVVQDGTNGFIVPAGDRAALAARLVQLAEDPELVACMSDAARRRVADFSFDRVAQQWKRAVTAAIEARATAAAS